MKLSVCSSAEWKTSVLGKTAEEPSTTALVSGICWTVELPPETFQLQRREGKFDKQTCSELATIATSL